MTISTYLHKFFNDNAAEQRAKLIGLYGFLIGVNVLAWGWAFMAFGSNPALLGTAFFAYVFGLRHAVDADHIAAIDNVVRKLMQEGKRPFSVGFFFSLGHSMLIILAVAAIAFTAAALQNRIQSFQEIGGIISTCVSAFFLLMIAITNFIILKGVWRSFRRVRAGGTVTEDDLDMLLAGRGFLARIFRPLFRLVSKSWHMFAIGFLFGLGFDTATEIGLFAVSASHAAQGVSVWSVMVFPVLFTAGMALIDTTDSVMMVGAYGWAFVNPIRKLWYNLTITAVSVLVAFFIGGLEALGLLVDKLQLKGGIWAMISRLNDGLENFGFIVIGVFVVSWLLSAMIYRWKRYDELLTAKA